MAHIVINNYCNLNCSYCFANQIKTNKIENMSIEEFKNALNFLHGDDLLGILGGEPTLHPQFQQILELSYQYAETYQKPIVLYTNGINLLQYWSQLQQYQKWINILINCNSPNFYTPQQYQSLLKSLNTIFTTPTYREVAELGCNLHLDCTDYSFIWKYIRLYQLHTIRVSVVSPSNQYVHYQNYKEEYFLKMKTILLNFIDNAIKHSVSLVFDCSNIPKCYFSEEELIKINSVSQFHKPIEWCEPPIDILTNYQAIPCFGNYQLVNYTDFDNIIELKRYFIYQINLDVIKKNTDNKCINCKKYQHFICQGGCLSFARKEQYESS